MNKKQTLRRALIIGLFTLLVVGASTLLISPQTEAIGCGGGFSSDLTQEWLLTPAANERTESGLYCDTARPICREECLVGCGTTSPQSRFRCFAN